MRRPSPDVVARHALDTLAGRGILGDAPTLAAPPRLVERPWSTLYFLSVLDRGTRRDLAVKIVRFPDQPAAEVSWQNEELLMRGQREFRSLTRVFDHFAAQPDRRLAAIRPVADLPEINAVVMEAVRGTALPAAASRRGRRADEWMRRIGEWLRWFHRIAPDGVTPEQTLGPADTLRGLDRRAGELRAAGVSLASWPLWGETRRILEDTGQGERVWIHGDFHQGNVLVLPDGGILCFDTALQLVDSPYHDLGKFTASLKTRRSRIMRLGLIPSQRQVEAWSHQLLQGYLDGQPVNHRLLGLYEGYFILEKWLDSLAASAAAAWGGERLLRETVVNPVFSRVIRRWMQHLAKSRVSPRP